MAGTRATGLASRNFAIADGVQPGPENTNCNCSDAPDVSTVERPVRGKRVCTHCETRVQARMTPHIIDKGTLSSGNRRRHDALESRSDQLEAKDFHPSRCSAVSLQNPGERAAGELTPRSVLKISDLPYFAIASSTASV